MDVIISEFEEKVSEIDEYVFFVQRTVHLRGFTIATDRVQVSSTVHNILKSNLFLLLSNLVEASFKNALEKLCIQITSENITYNKVIPEIKKLWIEKKYKNFENVKIPKNMQKSEFVMNIINSITEDIIEIKFYTDEEKRKNDDISGNVDAREINKINMKYGAKILTQPSISTQSLLTVKIQRNNLAHGDESFSECGRNYTLTELEEIKNESIDYMRFILNHIKEVIENKQYIVE
ncbi:MAG: Unknown protein [uncultured Sulfurovum sp.]|uniref:MAE-28990/MAE-18760-like HEPN domain-containing protein n=1 Tax=uncultured Sulfurovum sp. TaxID=269237 RepID=A0A6S6TU38_9BACT|nr:MAG: Unknown protein [uncultured Sulfurovum sp.]